MSFGGIVLIATTDPRITAISSNISVIFTTLELAGISASEYFKYDTVLLQKVVNREIDGGMISATSKNVRRHELDTL